ncbi:hypothetical protein LQ327_03525 [Actinomycetospora endophytica]|uniref:Uncharacterized protein n=1 Tax=Actinomycetospora endophytica TaxID=2291215 RepID=A0ABS8P346_9PSEU|nr:hypothetical protein [Actinomycetospora endophytica]MCD2192463.1 hypothetical protein [Actinomycetospora endophytica]
MTATPADAGARPPGPAPTGPTRPGPGGPAPGHSARAWWAAVALVVLAVGLRVAVAVIAPGPLGAPVRAAGVLAPLVGLVAAVAPGLATRRARRTPGAASLAAPAALGALGAGGLLIDLTLLLDPESAARPDVLPTGTSTLPPVLAVALVAADVALVAATVVATVGLVALTRVTGRSVFGTQRGASLLLPVTGALVAAGGLVASPFSVAGPGTGFAPHAVLDTPAPAGVGVALLAATVVVVALLPGVRAFGTGDDVPAQRTSTAADETGMRVRRAVHTALGAGLVAGFAPVLAASFARDGLAVSPGAVLAVVGGLLVIGLPARTAVIRSRAAGVMALLTAVAALFGALLPTLSGTSDAAGSPFVTGTGILLLPAAAVLAVPALLVVVGTPRVVVRARPTLSVAWLTVPFAAGPALDVVLAGVDGGGTPAAALDPGLGTAGATVPQVGVGTGGWAVVLALVLAALTAVLAVGAGFSERRDVAGGWAPLGARPADGTDTVEPDPTMLPMAAIAAVLAVPGFGGPLARDALAANAAGGAWQNPGAAAWGSLAGVIGVAIAALLAPRARPARALALLGAAGALLVVRLSALVLTPPRAGESVGIGTWAAVACLVITLAAAGVAIMRIREAARSPEPAPSAASVAPPSARGEPSGGQRPGHSRGADG